MSMSRDVVLRLIGDAESAKRALNSAAEAAGVTVREYRRAETLQRQQAAAAKRMAAEQAAAAEVVGGSMLKMGAAITAGLALAVKAAIDWESSFAGVKKVLKDPGSFDVVEKQLRGLAQILPVTHDEIARVAAAAAQLGVQDANVASFTKTMIMLGTTTNLSAEEAAMSIARFSNIMGTSQTKASNLGSAIVWLGNNFATTESEVVAMAMRLAGAGKQAGMTEADILGMGAAFSSVGIEAEAGGTAISKFMTQIGSAVRSGGTELDRFAQLAGTTAADFARKWQSDPAQAMASVITGLGRMQKAGGDVNGTLDQLGITEARMRDALLRSAAAGDVLSNALGGANNAFSENNALQQEAEARYSTTASQLAVFKNHIVEAAISLGQGLLPPLTAIVDAAKFVVEGFNMIPGPVKTVIAVLLGLIGASALGGAGLLKLKGHISEVSAAFATMKSADGFTGKLGGFLGLLGPAAAVIGIVTASISVLSSVFGGGTKYVKDYAGSVDEMADALRSSRGAIDDNVRAVAAKQAADEGILDVAKKAGVSLDKVTDAILGNKDAYNEVTDALSKYQEAKDRPGYTEEVAQATMAKEKLSELAGASKDAADKAKQQAEAAGESAELTGQQAVAADKAGQSSQEYAQAQADAADAADKTKKAVDELKNAFDQLNGANIDILEATSSMTLALAGMGEAVKANGTSLDSTTESGAKNVQVLSDMVSKAEDVVTATLQQTGSVAAANTAYGEQREKILAAAQAAGLNRDEVDKLLQSIFQMPDDLAVPTSTPGATEALVQLEKLNAAAYKASDGTVQVKAEALTDDAIAKLDALGIKATKMPDGTFLLTAQTADAQSALDVIKTNIDDVDGSKADVKVETTGTDKAISALGEVGAIVKQTPDGKRIVVESLTEDAYTKLTDLGFKLQSIPGEKGTVITAPGAPEAQAAIDAVNGAAVTLSNGEQVVVSAPGATQATGDIQGTQGAAITLSNGEQVWVSAPGATTATGQLNDTTGAANRIPGSKSTNVTAETGGAETRLMNVRNILAGIQSKTVYVDTVLRGGLVAQQADGGHVKFYANGGREDHVAQYAKAGTWRVWAEPETGGEWYIPDGVNKRGRSMRIAEQMLAGWGMQMVPAYAQQYAYGTPVTASPTAAVAGSTRTYNIAINGAGGDPEEIGRIAVQAIKDYDFLYGRG